MPDEGSKPPVLKIVLAIIVIVLALVSFLWRCKPSKTPEQVFENRIAESTGFVCAEEATKVLGGAGGRVVLILRGTDDAHFAGSTGELYERGFKQFAKKNSSLRFSGHFLTKEPSLTLELLQAIRGKFTDANLLVSFVGLPSFQRGEANQWRQSSPPKMIVVESVWMRKPQIEPLLKSGIVQTVFFRKDTLFPAKKPTESHEIFNLFYETHTSP